MLKHKVFLHYSWDNDEHQKWVLDLAKQLQQDNVDLIFDQSNLLVGGNITYFMERIRVVDKVIIVMTENYKSKSENRIGGVGYEFQLLTDILSENLIQPKIIPILKSGNKESSIPVILRQYLYVDMTDEISYAENYNKILKAIFQITERGKDYLYDNIKNDTGIESIFNLGRNKVSVHELLGNPEEDYSLFERYWSHGIEVFYNKHEAIVDGVLLKKQPSGIKYESDFKGIRIEDSFAKVKTQFGNPHYWGLPSFHTSYAIYKLDYNFLIIAIWKEKPDLDITDYKIGTVYAIAFCESRSALLCEPIVVLTIDEIRLGKRLSFIEDENTDNIDFDLSASFFKETYTMTPPYSFIGGGFLVSVLFQESKKVVDFWLYDLAWSSFVIRMIFDRSKPKSEA